MPISENELIIPALIIMLNSENFSIQTSDLINQLRDKFEPQFDEQDRAILLNRYDEKFTQIVRNLKSHKTFVRLNLAEEIEGGFRLLPAGAEWLESNGFTENFA